METNLIANKPNQRNNDKTHNIRRIKRPHDSVSTTRKTNKAKRMAGAEYSGFSRTQEKKIKQDVFKEARSIGPSCKSLFCKKRTNRHCDLFDEEVRSAIFESFWKNLVTWGERRIFVQGFVKEIPRRSTLTNSRKKRSFKFCLYLKGEARQICRQMFLSTLGLKRATVNGWINKTCEPLFGKTITKPLPIKKTQSSAWHIAQKNRKEFLISYLSDLEKMESHFCRKDTRKHYLTMRFFSKVELYRNYQKKCSEENFKFASYFTFATAFDKLSLALFTPRKDMCDVCVSFSVNQITKAEYDEHIFQQKKAQAEKTYDKLSALWCTCIMDF